ncbi:RagB/SusD family nutrient uptake outer membrane protein [Arcticibacter eurypsychrophilus]|uniref:RagB/SusD family nutrient uptake outer membrane protein n=1 Tax=Arcticibacter eurypsychrophilus TaxID=1434752 RepID=UPI00084D7DCF|nr:RagB/SusD family nutrient uptake outer membrane protein [Arcticibacter eurypsychrophilus]
MNNLLKLIYSSILVVICMVLPSSCSKSFLDEEYVTARNTSDFETAVGLDGVATGMYQSLRYHFNYEWAYATTNYGTDEFEVGGDRTEQMWNSYDANLNSITGDAGSVWDNMYGNINSANILIQNVPLFYGDGANKNTRLGEGYFMRAFDYFKLVKQFGGVPLKLIPSTVAEFEFTRATDQEVYTQIISDFIQAYEYLPETAAQTGRITKNAAAHFLAKAYLYRASELYSGWNTATKQSDLENAIKYADIVINSGRNALATDFRSLWEFTTVDGPNEKLPEVILAAQFSNNTATQGRYGNQLHLHYPSLYSNLAGMQRDLAGDREFQRLKATDFALGVYDRVNDSRFWKSFKTRYLCNKPAGAPVWTAAYAPSTALVGKAKFAGGEESILYIINNPGDTRYTAANLNLRAPFMFVRYFNGENENLLGVHGNYTVSRSVALSKFMDGSRNAVASQFGQRDGILARVAETYLIAAEAYGRLGQYAQALPYLNKVRDRAAYKAGEDRSSYADGGVAYKTNAVTSTAFVSYSDKNTYYESNNMANTVASSLTTMHLNSVADIFNSSNEFYTKLGATSDASKFLAFILNERSRELMGELMRWEDLSRTKTLFVRAKAFNSEAAPVESKHYLRPIPQTFLDIIKSGGQALTADQKTAMQNPGY